jgi:hypothetical protein
MGRRIKALWERLRGWRTIALNLGIAAGFAIAEILSYLSIVDWREFINPKWAPWVVVGINTLNILMRHITSTASPTVAIKEKIMDKVRG